MSSPETVKVVLLGQAGVGKTCIISKFITGDFNPNTISSLSAQYISKNMTIQDKVIKFDIWDTAGQERFRALAKIFYKDAKVICLCYDITSKESFNELKDYWYEKQTKLNANGDPIFAVVANKNDLYQSAQVKDEEGKAFAKSINGIFQSTSAKSDSGITSLFENIGKKYFDPNFDSNEEENKEKLEYEKKKTEKALKKTHPQTQNRGVKLEASKSNNSQKNKGCC